MKRLLLSFMTVAVFLWSRTLASSDAGGDLSSAVRALLDQPAPPPRSLQVVEDALAAQAKWPDPRLPDTPEPGPDAPPKVVIDYWTHQQEQPTRKAPSKEARWRLLDAVLADPRFFSDVLAFLPDTPKAYKRVKQFLDRPPADDRINFGIYLVEHARESLRIWLSRHSRYEGESLIKRSEQIFDQDKYSDDTDDLEALAALDWSSARPILEAYVNNGPAVARAFSLGLLLKHSREDGDTAEVESINARLKMLVTHPLAPAQARLQALAALLRVERPGGDEWLASVLEQLPSIAAREEVFQCVSRETRQDPDRWIPVLTRLVTHPNRNVHDCAVYCLADIGWHCRRVEAVMPLLPWLSDPGWSTANLKSNGNNSLSGLANQSARCDLIRAAGLLKVNATVPGLLSILEGERSSTQYLAAGALATLGEHRAVPLILPAIERALNGRGELRFLVDALLAFGTLSDEEKTDAFEALSREATVQEGWRDGEWQADFYAAKSVRGEIGRGLLRQEAASDALAESVLRRTNELEVSEPSVSQNLWLIAKGWKVPAVDVALAQKIADGSADVSCLITALQRRDRLRANCDRILRPLILRGGYTAGIAAVLTGNESARGSILAGSDKQAIIGLLAAARIVRDELDELQIGRSLKNENRLLGLASKRYLEAADTKLARKLLRENEPDGILILGARNSFDPSDKKGKNWESSLRRDIREGRVDEVFGVLEFSSACTSSTLETVEVRVRGNRAQICRMTDRTSSECRRLSPEALGELRDLFDEVSFDDLPPVILEGTGRGYEYQEFIRINRTGGRRVFAANLFDLGLLSTWTFDERTPHELINSMFRRLVERSGFERR